jgi:RNA polymerase sigma-70 factor (ECF subfamily)
VEVHRLCAHLVDPSSADDLAQETYLRACGPCRSYEARAPFRPWLLSIARRTCMDALRRRSRRRRLLVRLQGGLTNTVPDGSGDVGGSTCSSRLDPDRRAAFVLTQLLGVSYAEAATICNVRSGPSAPGRPGADQLREDVSRSA